MNDIAPQLRQLNSADVIMLQEEIQKKRTYFSWGMQTCNDVPFDTFMPLISEGQLVIFCGAEGSGKTTWSLQMALTNALLFPGNVGYLSLEVDPYRIARRYAERKAGFTRFHLTDGFTDPNEEKTCVAAIEMALKEFMFSSLRIIPTIDNSTDIATIAQICTDPSLKLLFIDNLAELTPDTVIRDEYSKYDYIVRYLLDICKQTKTTIILLHHLAKPKAGEPLTINSVKGNNIVITKADIVVAIDKHKRPNPNWRHAPKDLNGHFVDTKTHKTFMATAPLLEVRQIEVFKDRDWDERGVKGYVELIQGKVTALREQDLREKYTFFGQDNERYLETLQKLSLSPLYD